MKVLLGKKLHMSQKFSDQGVTPVTVVAAGPCTVTQVKADRDGYRAIQVGYNVTKKTISKSVAGHLKGLSMFKTLREFRGEVDAKRGQVISVGTFKPGDIVQVTGISKGKGFQGVVKRHHFSGGPKTHGNKDQHRMPGSIGATEPKHVFKGTRMGGHMGSDQVTVKNLEIIEVDEAQNLLYIKGAVPGARNGLLAISGEGNLVLTDPVAEAIAEPVAETTEVTAEALETETVASEATVEKAPEAEIKPEEK